MPPAKKKAVKKKTAASSRTARPKAAPKKETRAPEASVQPGSRRGPVYVLVILALLTVILLMLNRFYPGGITSLKQADKTAKTEKTEKTEKKAPRENKEQDGKDERIRPDSEAADRADRPDPTAEKPLKDAQVYFLKFNPRTESAQLASVKRKVSPQAPLEAVLKELIKGPSRAETRAGYLSAVPKNLRLRGVRIKGRSAELDFNGAIEDDAAGSILLSRLDQIIYTATQFSGVESVVIRVNGKARSTLGSDGLAVSGPLRRRK